MGAAGPRALVSRVHRLKLRTSQLRQNIVANMAGRVWVTLLGIAFIPIYLQFLGIEAYGLVGFFATLQGVFGLLDLGLGVTINRELARMSTGEDRRREQQSVLRTLEACYWTTSLVAGGSVFFLASPIARYWVNPSHLSFDTVTLAIRLMGLVLALQFPFSFYQAAMMGLQRQVALNVVLIITATVRSAGTAFVLWKLSPTVEAFFVCQVLVGIVQTVWTLTLVWSGLGGVWTTVPDVSRLRQIRGYAAATSANALVGIALTQLDKVLLSKLLTLEQFGYYALAGTMASFVWAIAIPVNQALFPRFAQLVETGDGAALTALYHRAAQVMTLALAPAAIVVALFSWYLIVCWTRNAAAANQTALIASLLIAGTAVNGIVSVPGYLQAAAGWPQLMVYTNMAAAVVLVPAILLMAPRYGAPGAAFVWLVLNIGYVLFNVPLMHRRLLRGEQWRWYRDDVGRPVAVVLAIAITVRWLMPAEISAVAALPWIAAAWLLASIACALVEPGVRATVFGRTRLWGVSGG
jgi:O-antigen/teichoic acid export membrane protein